MNARRIFWPLLAAGVVAAVILWVAHGSVTRAANNSEQIIFSDSGTGSGTFVNPSTGNRESTPFGFWVWCEGDSTNPYQGNCQGAMYFYAFAITKHVSGTVAETATPNSYMMSVASSDGAVHCALTNTPPITKGLTNTVSVVCSAPSGSGSDKRAVVHATGP